MDKLKAALASSKQQLHGNWIGKRKAADAAAADEGGEAAAAEQQGVVKRFKTKREIDQERQQQLQQQQREQRAQSTATAQADDSKQATPSNAASLNKPSSSLSFTAAASTSASDNEPLAFEVKRRLRALSHPITLFAETDGERWQRLRATELSREEASGRVEGTGRNVFHELLTSEVESELKQVLLEEMEQAKGHNHNQTRDALPTDIAASSGTLSTSQPTKRAHKDYSVTLSLSDFASPNAFILYFFKRCLSEWEQQLDARPTDVKRTLQGKVASATQKQTRSYLKPLFLLLKAQQLDSDIRSHLLSITQHCMAGQYKAAEEVYLRLAIGTAPWPMGVTMVGIHERSGREKIFSEHVAHVLNDETARKYIQSVKRCVSWCQQHYPRGLKGEAAEEEESKENG